MFLIFPNIVAILNLIVAHFSSKKKRHRGEYRGLTGMVWSELRFLGKYLLFLTVGM
jgi:hypothetical protein